MRICIDLDGVICQLRKSDEGYEHLEPVVDAIDKVQALKEEGHYIIIYTARRMRTHSGSTAKVIADIGKTTLDWLVKYNIPYDEIMFGKPWADIYIDDNAFRFTDWNQIASDGSDLPMSHEKKVRGDE
ncbi:MAG TPA: capsular biosynthesis protein [Flavobacteriaceae bacterium]|nr:capsular biosynthesis protein [Flavobacteriaceae bacterium]